MAATGLAGPFVLRAWITRRPVAPLVVVAAHVSALLVAWAGLLGVLGRHHHLLGLCEVLLGSLWESPALLDRLAAAVLVLALPGRALLRVRSSVTAHRRLRGALVPGRRGGGIRQRKGMGAAAVTVGLVRPVVVYDPAVLGGFHRDERQALLAHERAHAVAHHGLIVALVEGLAAGLHPWPGAAVARDEVRRHLEAHADGRAARRTSPATVARTILRAGSAAPDTALGMAGWPVWRVERLLSARPSRLIGSLCATGAVATAAVGIQGSAHALWGSHVVPALHALC